MTTRFSEDLDMAEIGKKHGRSICVLVFSESSERADYNPANGRLPAEMDREGVRI